MEKLANEGSPKSAANRLAGWPQFEEKAISAGTKISRSGMVNSGTAKKTMEFEKTDLTSLGGCS